MYIPLKMKISILTKISKVKNIKISIEYEYQ